MNEDPYMTDDQIWGDKRRGSTNKSSARPAKKPTPRSNWLAQYLSQFGRNWVDLDDLRFVEGIIDHTDVSDRAVFKKAVDIWLIMGHNVANVRGIAQYAQNLKIDPAWRPADFVDRERQYNERRHAARLEQEQADRLRRQEAGEEVQLAKTDERAILYDVEVAQRKAQDALRWLDAQLQAGKVTEAQIEAWGMVGDDWPRVRVASRLQVCFKYDFEPNYTVAQQRRQRSNERRHGRRGAKELTNGLI